MEKTLEKIYNTGLRLLATLTPEETYSTIIEEALRLVDGDFGSVVLIRDDVMERVYASNPVLYNLIAIRKKGFTYKAAQERDPSFLSVDTVKRVQPALKELGIKTIIFIPLLYENKPWGVLTLNSKENKKLTQGEIDTLKLFGAYASLAIKKTQHYYETKQAVELRDYFISAAAHELRTPLTSISGYIQLLLSKMQRDGEDSVEKKWVDQLYNETNRLTYLINELLEVNRIRAGKAEYKWDECYLNDIILRAINRLKYHYPNHEVYYENQLRNDSGYIIGDFDRLLQVVYNLLENAAEYSNPGTTITIKLTPTKQNYILKIKDMGIGIPVEHIHQIFHGHFKPKREDREKGIGIGLFLVKNILDNHHASIDIKSKINKGTSVTIKLPKYKK